MYLRVYACCGSAKVFLNTRDDGALIFLVVSVDALDPLLGRRQRHASGDVLDGRRRFLQLFSLLLLLFLGGFLFQFGDFNRFFSSFLFLSSFSLFASEAVFTRSLFLDLDFVFETLEFSKARVFENPSL